MPEARVALQQGTDSRSKHLSQQTQLHTAQGFRFTKQMQVDEIQHVHS
jgi:hypothetical protein